jgi:ferredoxin
MMGNIILKINWMVLAVSDLLLLLFLVSSLREREWRAALISILAFGMNSGLWISLHLFLYVQGVFLLNLVLLMSLAVFVILSLLRFFPSGSERDPGAARQYDERDIMFSRNNLKFYPDLAEKYYTLHPKKRETDGKIHRKPEIGEPGGIFYEPFYSQTVETLSSYLKRVRDGSREAHLEKSSREETTGESPLAASKKAPLAKEKIAQAIREISYFYGAVDIGMTTLRPYHFYTHAGRHAENWGEEIRSSHSTAMVIVVAMDIEMIKAAPALPVILESSRQYVEAAKIANIVAQYLRDLGYDARAHTDGNYEVLCVPLAVEAGLGALGRLGLLMHPVYGPCVRLSVVTTDLEFPPADKKAPNGNTRTIEHFCEICKKCADNCPTQSICGGEEPSSRGFRHWSIHQETCYSYWKVLGTDCGFCIRVCPYTKPNTLLHQLIRFYISRNALNQRIALFLDDFFYGRKPPLPHKNPKRLMKKT